MEDHQPGPGCVKERRSHASLREPAIEPDIVPESPRPARDDDAHFGETGGELAEGEAALPSNSAAGPSDLAQTFSSTSRSEPAVEPDLKPDGPAENHHGAPRPTAAADEEAGSPSSSDREKPPPAPSHPAPLTMLFTISHLTLFALLGTLARLGLQALTTYPGAPVTTPVLWANIAGSFILGFLVGTTTLFAPPPSLPNLHRDKRTLPLYVGLATGFCGSLTSFSSFQRDVFLALADSAPPNPDTLRSPGQSFLALLASLILTPTTCVAALHAGAHAAQGLDRWTPRIPAAALHGADVAAVPLAALCWLGAVVLAIWPPDRPDGPAAPAGATSWDGEAWRGQVLFALALAPPGCLLRWRASVRLNARAPSFPLGTFAVNVGGTLLEALLWDLQHAALPGAGGLVGGGRIGCQVLQGAMDGFCGCLTTVSTWVAEMQGLGPRRGYVYGAASVAAGLAGTVVVMGSLRWTVGFAQTACGA